MPSKDLASDWKSYEVCELDEEGYVIKCPVSDALAVSNRLAQAVNKMLQVQTLGPNDAIKSLTDDHGKALLVKKEGDIWLLKCKPSCWRVYFYVSISASKERRITYVHAVCKQQDKEDPQDAIYARRIADDLRAGSGTIAPLDLPFS